MPADVEADSLREKARQARIIAAQISDKAAAAGLVRYAEEYEARAAALEATEALPPAAAIPSGEPPIAHASAALKPLAPEAEPETEKPENSD